jgi:hypothetical protein
MRKDFNTLLKSCIFYSLFNFNASILIGRHISGVTLLSKAASTHQLLFKTVLYKARQVFNQWEDWNFT